MKAYAWACEGVATGFLLAYGLFGLLNLYLFDLSEFELLRPALFLIFFTGGVFAFACSVSIRLMARRPEPSRAPTEEWALTKC
jgi:hypothetical protein